MDKLLFILRGGSSAKEIILFIGINVNPLLKFMSRTLRYFLYIYRHLTVSTYYERCNFTVEGKKYQLV